MAKTFVCVAIVLLGCGVDVKWVPEISISASGVQLSAADASAIVDSDWPGWRGPSSDGAVLEQALPTTWSETENVVWKATVPGRGHSSPIVVGDQVFLATSDESKQEQMVLAFDRRSGRQLWSTIVSQGGFTSTSQMHKKSTHANGTLVCDGQHVYGAFLAHDAVTAFALDLQGTEVWKQQVSTFNSKFGYAPSPLLYRSFVIVAADNRGGGCIAALDSASGKIAWRKQRPAVATYSSPVVATVAGCEQLFISGCDQVVAYDPATGEQLWACDAISEATCGTVVWNDKHVFASGGYPDTETVCIAADGTGEKIWSGTARVYEPSMSIFEDYLYAITDKGIAHCFAAETGEEKWKKRLGGNFSASPVICNGLIYVTNDRGKTHVFQASPRGFEGVAENQLGTHAYASPAVSRGQLFLRVGVDTADGGEELLYCIGATVK